MVEAVIRQVQKSSLDITTLRVRDSLIDSIVVVAIRLAWMEERKQVNRAYSEVSAKVACPISYVIGHRHHSHSSTSMSAER